MTEIVFEFITGDERVIPGGANTPQTAFLAGNVIVDPPVLDTTNVQAALTALAETGGGPGDGSGAPIGASYIVVSASPTLTADRVLTAGSGVTITDAGAQTGTVTVAAAVESVAGKTGAVTLTATDVGLGSVTNAAQVTAVTGTAPIVSSGGTTPAISISEATTGAAGSMSAADKSKLDGIAAGAQVNAVTSVAGKTGAVTLAKADVGLGNVDNTSDANKPVSTATQTALDGKANTSHTHAWGDITSGVPSTFTPSAHKSTHATGGTDAIAPADIGAAAASHTHAASDVTSGTFNADRIPTLAQSKVTNLETDLAGKAASSHSHGNITTDGKIDSTAGLPVVTGSGGVVTTLALGTAGQVLTVNSGATGVEFAAAGGGASVLNDLTDVTISSAQAGQVLKYDGSAWVNDTDQVGSGGGGAPIDAQYLVLSADGVLSQERVFVPGDGIAGTDATGNYTLAVDLAANPGLEIDSAKLRAKIKANGGLVRDGDGLSVSLGTGATDAAAGNHTHSDATGSVAGFLSASDKSKLDGIATGATANTGTVTSVATGDGLTGGAITTSGTLSVSLAANPGLEFSSGALRAKVKALGGVVRDGDGLSVDGSLFADATHTHGNITATGSIGSTANLPLITTTGGLVTTGAFGTSANQFAEGNHTHAWADITSKPSDFTPSAHTHGLTDSYVGEIAAAADQDYTIDLRVPVAREVTEFSIISASGTCTAALKKGSDTIVGSVSVSSTIATKTGGDLNGTHKSLSANDKLTLTISSNSTPVATRVQFCVKFTAATGAIS